MIFNFNPQSICFISAEVQNLDLEPWLQLSI